MCCPNSFVLYFDLWSDLNDYHIMIVSTCISADENPIKSQLFNWLINSQSCSGQIQLFHGMCLVILDVKIVTEHPILCGNSHFSQGNSTKNPRISSLFTGNSTIFLCFCSNISCFHHHALSFAARRRCGGCGRVAGAAAAVAESQNQGLSSGESRGGQRVGGVWYKPNI